MTATIVRQRDPRMARKRMACMVRLLGWAAVWLVLASASLATADASAGRDDLASGPIYWGANIRGWPDRLSAIDDFEKRAGKRVSIVNWGAGWQHRGVTLAFQTKYFQAIRDRGSIPLLNWASINCCAMDQPNYRLADIAAGAHDEFVIAWARAAKAWGHPFFLRFNHEMNTAAQPWSEQNNGAKPGDFVAAWRHVVDLFRAEDVTNVTWVWCPNVAARNTTPMSGLYPGDDYVDWTCLDGYNWSSTLKLPWLSFAQVFRGSAANGHQDSYQALIDIAPNKPIMIGETSSAEQGGSKAEWITTTLGRLALDFPRVRAFVWFEHDGNDQTTQWPILTSPAAAAAFSAGIASPTFTGNDFGTLDVSPIPARPPIASAVVTDQRQLGPSADTYISRVAYNTNYGGATRLQVGGREQAVAYLRFDLSSLADAALAEAKLRIKTAARSGAGSQAPARIMLVQDTVWQELGIAYSTRAPVSSIGLGAISGTGVDRWYEVVLDTRAVQPTIGHMLSLAILPPDNADDLFLMSRESDEKPVLQLTYQTRAPAQAAAPPAADPRYFDATHFRVDDDRIWGYFNARGAVDVFGYPVSRTFTFLGCKTQVFQRQVAQVCDDGQPRLLNLLDPEVFPYTAANGSTLPEPDEAMKAATPSVGDPAYAASILRFVRANVPDNFEGLPVNFASTFLGLITPTMAGTSDSTQLGLINLEVWGAPISQPMLDPANSNFMYQRFQRGVMHFDASTGVTRGLLLADYLKAILTGKDLPPDLQQQAQGGWLYSQYCPSQPWAVCRPDELPGTDLTGAFDPQ